jgi:hypothetical protein
VKNLPIQVVVSIERQSGVDLRGDGDDDDGSTLLSGRDRARGD